MRLFSHSPQVFDANQRRIQSWETVLLTALLQITPDPDFPGHFDASLSAQKVQVARILRQEVQTADINWYIGIAEHGYERRPVPKAGLRA